MERNTHERLQELTPSGKLVLKLLEYDGGLTQKQLVERSRLSARTVRNALGDLEDAGVLERKVYPPDARQTLYVLTEQPPSATTGEDARGELSS